MSGGLTVDIQSAGEVDRAPDAAAIRHWVAAALAAARYTGAAEVSVRLVGEQESAALNERYRQKPGATNVLSFPAGGEGVPVGVPTPLGDIVVCAPVVEREAEEQGKPALDHWSHMLVHGTLHLLGYDHVTDAEAAAMEDIEKSALAGLGVADPYAPG